VKYELCQEKQNVGNGIRYKFHRSVIILSKYLETSYYRRFYNIQKQIEKQFIKRFGRKPNLESPQTFNEKLQWLKLYWRDEKAARCADKLLVRDYVREKNLGNILNELIAVYDDVRQINIDELPQAFVLKTTHGSGWNIICKNKHQIDWEESFLMLEGWMHRNYYYGVGEWVYQNLKPRIICEKYLQGEDGNPPVDYKFLCFDGEPKLLFVCLERFSDSGLKVDFYDMEWNKMPFRRYYPNSDVILKKPEQFDEMVAISRKLAEGFPFVRVDLFVINDRVYFSELTFFPGSGYEPFDPEEYDYLLGSYLTLPKSEEVIK